MCPPASVAPAAELNEYSPDEIIFKSLLQLKSGSSLPLNILSDVDPYQFMPSNLPADMWYFCSGTKMDAENGFWRPTGEACEIYSTSVMIGLRKTFEFYEGQAPNGEKTNWMMQEYTTTEKHTSKPDPRALYRVFLVDASSNITSGRLSKSELLEKNNDDVAGPSAMADQSLDVLIGDYLELDDLATPLSRTTSSGDSSCMTMTSEDFFDSDALMRKLGDDVVDQEIQDPKINLNLSTPAKLKEVVIHSTTLATGSVDGGEETKPCTGQTSKTDPSPQNEGTSNGVNTRASSSSNSSSSGSEGGSSKEEKKDRVSRTKKRKMMKYLCFLAF